MRRLFGLVLGLVISGMVVPSVLAGAPGIYRDHTSFSGWSYDWSTTCGFDVFLAEDSRFTVVDRGDAGYDVHFDVRRTLTGPGGSVDITGGYSFGARQPVESFVDPDTGLYTEIYRETTRGTLFVRSGGVTFKVAGSLYSTLTISYPDGSDPIVTVEDVVARGIQPGDIWGLSPGDRQSICATLA